MKRRAFLGFLAGFLPAAALAKVLPPAEPSCLVEIDQAPKLFTGEIGRVEGVSIREMARDDLAKWWADEFDKKAYDALLGIEWNVQEFDFGNQTGVMASLPSGRKNAVRFFAPRGRSQELHRDEMVEAAKERLRKWAAKQVA